MTVSMLRASLAFQDDAFLGEYCGGLRLAGLPNSSAAVRLEAEDRPLRLRGRFWQILL